MQSRHARDGLGVLGTPCERDRAMGFCFYNNVAASAAHALTLRMERS